MPIKTLLFAVFCSIAAPSFCANLASSPGKSTLYTVQKGDSLWTISQETWKNSSKWPLLYAANQEAIQDPNLILPGQKFSIPSSIIKGQLQKAIELVQRDFPKPKSASKSRSAVSHKAKGQAPPQEKPKEDPAPPAAAEATATRSTSSDHSLILILLAILAFGAILYRWSRYKSSSAAQAQRSGPASSFRPPPPNYNQPSTIRPPPPAQTQASPSKPAETQASPVTPSLLPIVDTAANTYVQQGRFMEAAKVYRAILENDPGNVEIGRKLIRVEEMMRTRTAELASAQAPPPEPKPSEPQTFSGTITSVSTPTAPPAEQPPPASVSEKPKPPDAATPPPSPEIKPPSEPEPPK